jgi:hypothetical protein
MGHFDERDRGLSVDRVSPIGHQQQGQIKTGTLRSYATDKSLLFRNTYCFLLSYGSEVWKLSRILALVQPATTRWAGRFDFTGRSGRTHRRSLYEREFQTITIQDTEKMKILRDHWDR